MTNPSVRPLLVPDVDSLGSLYTKYNAHQHRTARPQNWYAYPLNSGIPIKVIGETGSNVLRAELGEDSASVAAISPAVLNASLPAHETVEDGVLIIDDFLRVEGVSTTVGSTQITFAESPPGTLAAGTLPQELVQSVGGYFEFLPLEATGVVRPLFLRPPAPVRLMQLSLKAAWRTGQTSPFLNATVAGSTWSMSTTTRQTYSLHRLLTNDNEVTLSLDYQGLAGLAWQLDYLHILST